MNESETKEWHAITVTLPQEGSDWISHLLIDLGSVGNIEEDCPDPALVAVKGYFPTELGTSNAIIQSILSLLAEEGIEPLSTYSTTIKIQNWAESARQMFSPIKILDKLTIVSPWSNYVPEIGEEIVVINPGMAFGTGLHATTQLAARLMSKVIEQKDIESMCDVGSGSGIQGIIAAKKGVGKIASVEIDSDARESSEHNVARNGLSANIKLYDNIDAVKGSFDMLVSNILYSTIIELKNKLIKKVKNNGFLVLSGIMSDEDDKFVKNFSAPGTKLVEKMEREGWMGYMFQVCRNF